MIWCFIYDIHFNIKRNNDCIWAKNHTTNGNCCTSELYTGTWGILRLTSEKYKKSVYSLKSKNIFRS